MFGDETGGIVVDYGSHCAKFGFAGEDCPRLVTATTLPFAEQFRLGLSTLLPAAEGGTGAQDHPIMCIIPALLPTKEQVGFTETLLEDGQTPAVYLLRSPVASAFASGKTSALVLDLGAGAARCSPVFQGFTLLKPTCQLEACGGAQLTSALLASCRPALPAKRSLVLAEELKLLSKFEPQEHHVYTLPDGTGVEYDANLVQDALFPALPDMVFDSLGRCDPDLRKLLVGEMLVVGGGSLFKGLGERLSRELADRLNPYFKPKVHSQGTSIERHFAPFVGGSILACLGSFQQEWASRQEVLEVGAENLCLARFVH